MDYCLLRILLQVERYMVAVATPFGMSLGKYTTRSIKYLSTKGSIGHTLVVHIHIDHGNQSNQAVFYSFVLCEIYILTDLPTFCSLSAAYKHVTL